MPVNNKAKITLFSSLLCSILSNNNKCSLAFQTTITRKGIHHLHMATRGNTAALSEPYNADQDEAEQLRIKTLNQQKHRRQQKQTSSIQNDDPEWKFFDTARIHVSGGDGGNGCVAFRREKGEPMGGPSGGRGGSGGSIYMTVDTRLNTLASLRNNVHVRANKGKNGIGKNKDGKHGADVVIAVPPGTAVRELQTGKLAGELREEGEELLVARGGRGGRGNAAFMTPKRTAPKLAERGEPGAKRWLSVELRLVADVGFLGKPNAGKSTLLSVASAAKPKIANYPFTTIVPNLGVCDLDEGEGLVLCDVPGLIEGAAQGTGLGITFLRHVQRCRVLLHIVDGTSEDPIGDFRTINKELEEYDPYLATKPQVVVLNKMDVPEVKEKSKQLMEELRKEAGHTRVLSISAATTENVKELMSRLKKFVVVQPESDLPPLPEIDFSKAGLDYDSDDFEIMSDPAYPGQWRISGNYIEQVAKMTHWEYPEAIERFGRQLDALGISAELERRGAMDGDLIMIDEYDFDFAPGMTNPYIPPELLEKDLIYEEQQQLQQSGVAGGGARGMLVDDKKKKDGEEEDEIPWRPFTEGGYLDVDREELVGFEEEEDWDMLDEAEFDDGDEYVLKEGDDMWTSS